MWLLAIACGGTPEPSPQTAPTKVRSEQASLYDLDLHLETTRGAATLDLNRGHPVILGMFYTSCQEVCPMTITKIQGIEAKLSPDERSRLRVLLVSLDPERDTIAAFEEVEHQRQLDERWTLGRLPEDQVRELSAALGIQYRKLADGEMNHSTTLTVLDGSGVARGRIESLGASDDELLAMIRTL